MKTELTDREALDLLEHLDPTITPSRNGAPVRQLAAAVDARDTAQARVDDLVHTARASGATWIEIAAALHVSPQGARQRYHR